MNKTRKEENLERIAYHEAGHAVIVHHFGGKLGDISIKANIKSFGRTKNEWDKLVGRDHSEITKDDLMLAYRQFVIGCLGGFAAEFIYDREPENFHFSKSEKDLKDAEAILAEMRKLQPSKQNTVELIFPEAVQILRMKWTSVKVLSAGLIQKGTISGEGAAKIIESERGS
jgi:hypothetical protein